MVVDFKFNMNLVALGRWCTNVKLKVAARWMTKTMTVDCASNLSGTQIWRKVKRILQIPSWAQYPPLAAEKEGLQVFRSHISKRKKRYTVCIEGNIGCGKSTFLKYFENDHTVETLKEPVQQWTDVQGHNALQLLYEDPARWNFSFNNYAMLTRMEMHKKRPDALVKLLERSLYSTRYVFVENSHRSGLLTSLEYTVLDEWFQYLLQSQEVNVDLIVYLRASPQICYERLRKRDRKEEAGVPIEFIQELHDLHEEWLIEKNKYPLPAPVLVLDASHDLPEMFKVYDEHRAEILCGASP